MTLPLEVPPRSEGFPYYLDVEEIRNEREPGLHIRLFGPESQGARRIGDFAIVWPDVMWSGVEGPELRIFDDGWAVFDEAGWFFRRLARLKPEPTIEDILKLVIQFNEEQ